MVELAIILGIFSYLVFGLGIMGKLGDLRVIGMLGVLGIAILIFKNKFILLKKLKTLGVLKQDKISVILISLLLLSALVNLVGALGPELGFDALWYHLTIPKIFLQQQKIFFIPGSLFYYSAMPKLTEMFYLVSLVFSPNGTLAKTMHFSFGILSAIALYNLAKRYLKTRESLLTVLIFYTTIIVGWQSITAYVDLARTFFEILALDLFLRWEEKNERTNMLLIESAMMLGLAISTKLIALASVPVYILLILIKKENLSSFFYFRACEKSSTAYFLFFIFLIPLPWFVFSYLYTGNPVYPIFSGILDQSHRLVVFSLVGFLKDFWILFYRPPDPISPVFLIFLPVVLLGVLKGKLRVELKVIASYVFLSLLFWYFTSRTGGSRFILPYLPAISLLIVSVVSNGGKSFRRVIIIVGILSAVINISYRALANKKYIPVIFGNQSRNEFLAKNLNFQNGDFFDLKGDLGRIIKKDDLTLIYGSHNIFYVDFPFVHSSYATSLLPVSYILVQSKDVPKDIPLGGLIYKNQKSEVKLYLSKKGF